MTFGVIPTGFNAKDFNTILTEVEDRARVVFGAPDLDVQNPAGMLASVYLPLVEQITSLWEVAEIVYNAPDPRRSTGQSYEVVGALRGVTRKPATVGTHSGVDFVFDSAVAGTINRGDITFHPENQGENVWINSDEFVIGSSGTYVVAVESELVGSSKILSSGATVEIEDGPGELTDITVATDAVSGTDLEEESAWRARSDAVISEEQTPVGKAVEDAVEAVVSARVVETPGHIRTIINDDEGGADDDEIAQAIYDAKCQGVITLGSESGQAINVDSVFESVYFDRVDIIEAYAIVNISSVTGYSDAAVKVAIQSVQPDGSGQDVIWSRLSAAVSAVAGVDDVVDLFIGTSATPTLEQNISSGIDEQIAFPDLNIEVNQV